MINLGADGFDQATPIVSFPSNPLVPTVSQDDLASRLADSDRFGGLSDLTLLENDNQISQRLGQVYLGGGASDPLVYYAMQLALSDALGAPKPPIPPEMATQVAAIYTEFGDGLRDYVTAVHETTQDYLASQGDDTLTLYHGLDYTEPPTDLHFDGAARLAHIETSGITVYGTDASTVIANGLSAQQGLDPANFHVIFGQQVAAADVFSLGDDGLAHVLPNEITGDALYLGWDAANVHDAENVVSLLQPGGGEQPPSEPPAPPESPPGDAQGQPPAPPGDIYQQTWDYRDQLLNNVADAQAALADSYSSALSAIQAELEQLAGKIAEAQFAGTEVDPTWLVREAQLTQTLADIEDRINAANAAAQTQLQQQLTDAANLGVAATNAQLDTFIPNLDELLAKAGVDTLWGQPSRQALENMVGAGADPNSPLNMAFGALGQAAIDLIKHGLFNGLALGENPHTTASKLASDVQDLTLSRANNIARTEMLRGYRTASLMTYQENSDVVDGWIWLAALSTNTCAFCWAENGGFHTSDETLDSHASCACVMLPVTGGWGSVMSDLEDIGIDESDLEDMGIDFSAIDETSIMDEIPAGEDIFAEQPPEVQQEVLGPGKYALYQNGDLALQDLVGHYQDEQWGGVGYEKSLKELGFTPEDIAAAKEALAAREAEIPTVPVTSEPPKTPNEIAQEAGDAYRRLQQMEEEIQQAAKEANQPTTLLGKIKAWADLHLKTGAADQAWREEIARIDARLLQGRLKAQGRGPLADEADQAAKRLLEERYKQSLAERGVGPLTDEVARIEQEQLDQRLKRRREGGPSFAPKQEEQPAAPVKTYTLTAEDKAFAASIREQIGPNGVLDHEQAITIGKQIQERIAEQTQETARWAEEAADIQKHAPYFTESERAWAGGLMGTPQHEQALAAHGGVAFTDAGKAYQAEYSAHVVAYLQEIRGDTGGLGGEQLRLAQGDEYATARLNEAAKFLPSDWIKANNALGEITPVENTRTNVDGWFLQDSSFETGNAQIAIGHSIHIQDMQEIAYHELIHRMEVAVPQLGKIEDQFYQKRTAGETARQLTNGIVGETKVDQWLDEYLGTVPKPTLRPEYILPDGTQGRTAVNYELLSNGADMALGHVPQAAKFAQDREFEQFTLGSLAGVKARVGEIPLAEGETGPVRAARNPAPFHQVEEPPSRPAFAAKKTGEGVEYSDPAENRKAIKSVFGHSLTLTDLRGLVGAPEGSRVEVYSRGEGNDAVVELKLTGPQNEFEATRYVSRSDDGSLVVRNLNINVQERGQGLGSKILADQVKTLTRLGVKEIITSAEGSGGMGEPGYVPHENGYYTWARLGYQGDLPEGSLQMLRDAVSKGEVPKAWGQFTTVQELMATPEGQAWWKEYGSTFIGTFDLTPGSKSHQTLDAYLKEKGIETTPQPKPFSRGAIMTKWNNERTTYQNNKRPLAQDLAKTASYLEAEARAGRGPGTPRYDELEQQFKETKKQYRAAIKQEGKPPSVTAGRVSVPEVRPPKVRTLTAEQQAKRDAADATRAAKAATTITKVSDVLGTDARRQAQARAVFEQALKDSEAAGAQFTKALSGRSEARVEAAREVASQAITKLISAGYEAEHAQWAADAGRIHVDMTALDAAKTPQQAVSWAKEALPHVELGFRDVASGDTAKVMSVLRTYGELAQQYPEIAASVRVIGLRDAPELAEYAQQPSMRIGFAGKTFRLSEAGGQGAFGDGIAIGEGAWRTARAGTEGEKFVGGGDDSKYLNVLITHEFGHAVQDFLESSPDEAIRSRVYALEDKMRAASGKGDAVSRYAEGNNVGEMFAESFAALQHGTEAQRSLPYVRELGDLLKSAKATTPRAGGSEALIIRQGDLTARVEPDPNLGGYRLTLDGQTTEGATLARVNALLKERLGYGGAVKAGQVEPGLPKTAAEKKAYRESGVKNATTVEKPSADTLRFTRPDGQAVTVERDMLNGGYKVTVGKETTEGLTIAKANALLKPFLGYNAPLAKEALSAGVKPKPVKPAIKPPSQEALDRVTAALSKVESLYEGMPVGDPQTLEGDINPYSQTPPELQKAIDQQEATLNALASELLDNASVKRMMNYVSGDLKESAQGWEYVNREKWASMTPEERKVAGRTAAMSLAMYDVFEEFHSAPAESELFVTNPFQVALQEAARSEFKLKGAKGYYTPEDVVAAKEQYGTYQNGLKIILRQMYDDTQAYFKELGITEIPVYRGMRWVDGKQPSGVTFDGQPATSTVNSLPMGSWSTDPQVALDYANSAGGPTRPGTSPADYGMVIAGMIPVDQVMSLAFTGFGTSTLREVILLGGKQQFAALPFTQDHVPDLAALEALLAGGME